MIRIKELRKENRYSQTELAKKLGVSQMSISSWERGQRDPDTDTLVKIAAFFGVSVDYLVGASNNRFPGTPAAKEATVSAPTSPPGPGAGFGASLPSGMAYDDISEEGKAELYKFYQYLKNTYPRQ